MSNEPAARIILSRRPHAARTGALPGAFSAGALACQDAPIV